MRLPRSLPVFFRLLLITIFLKQIMWMAFIPMWQFPDEQAHFAQVQNVAEGNPINPARTDNTSREVDESERILGTKRDGFGNNRFTYHPEYNLEYTSGYFGLFEDTIRNFPRSYRKEFVTNEATAYPPAYYELLGFFYNFVSNQDLIWRVFSLRLVNICLYLILVGVTYRISQLIFPTQQLWQITLTIWIGFHPMLSFVSAGINSDNLFNAVVIIFIYLCMRLAMFGWKWWDSVWLLLVVVLATWTKPHGKLVTLFLLFPVLTWLLRKKLRIFMFGAILVAVGVFVKYYFLHFVLNQQVLPDVGSLSLLPISFTGYSTFLWESTKHIYRETFPWYWGIFRWLSLTYVRPVHRIINWITVVGLTGFALWMVKMVLQRKKSTVFVARVFLVYVSVVYALALMSFDYLFTLSHGFSLGLQGRYFFPTIVGHMAILLVGCEFLCNRFRLRERIVKIFSIGMILLHTYAFVYVVSSYYSLRNMQQFFIQASQYKPWFFKSPLLELLTITNFVSLVIFLWYYIRIGARRSAEDQNTIK